MSETDRRVLIVEDDPDIVDYLSFFLEDEGYAVEAASRCSTAREMMDDFRPEVILIDALLPGKSGLELLVSLRRDPDWSDLPMVVVTGNAPPPLPYKIFTLSGALWATATSVAPSLSKSPKATDCGLPSSANGPARAAAVPPLMGPKKMAMK